MKSIDLKGLRSMRGFAAVDESKLANVALKLTEGKTFAGGRRGRSFQELDKTRRATSQLARLPAPGESTHCILCGEYSLYEFIPAFIEMSGAPIDELRIATLGFSKKNVADIAGLVDAGKIKHVAVLCSHYFSAADSHIYKMMVEAFAARKFQVIAMRTHAKVLLARIRSTHLTVESSANLRSCHNVEQATIINDPALYAFHARWIDELMDKGRKQPTKCEDRRQRPPRS